MDVIVAREARERGDKGLMHKIYLVSETYDSEGRSAIENVKSDGWLGIAENASYGLEIGNTKSAIAIGNWSNHQMEL